MDGWIPSLGFAPPDVVVGMHEQVLAAAVDAGRRPEAITCVYNVEVRVDERTDRSSAVVTGSPDAVAERLAGFLRLGFTAMNLMPAGPAPMDQAERLAHEVIPAVRAAAA